MNTPRNDKEWSALLKQLKEENDCEHIWQMLLSAPPIWARCFALALVAVDWTPLNFAEHRLFRSIVTFAKQIEERELATQSQPDVQSNSPTPAATTSKQLYVCDSLSIVRASADGRFLFAYTSPGHITAKNLETLKVLDTIDVQNINEHDARMLTFEVSPDGSHVAAHLVCIATSLEALKVWKFNGTKFALRFEQKWHGIKDEIRLPSESLYLMQMTMKLLNIRGSENIRDELAHYLKPFPLRMSYLRFSNDGKLLAHLKEPFEVVLWNVRLGRKINIFNPRSDRPDKEPNVAVSRGVNVVYKVVNGPSEPARNAGIPDYVSEYSAPSSVHYRPYSSARTKSAGGTNNSAPPEECHLWTAPWDLSCSPIAFSSNNRLMALCSGKEVLILSVPSFKVSAQIPAAVPRSVLLTGDGDAVIFIDGIGQLKYRDLAADESRELQVGSDYDVSLVMAPNKQYFAFRVGDSITIYAPSIQIPLKRLSTSLRNLASLQFLDDGSLLNIDAGGAVEKHMPDSLGEKLVALISGSINEFTMEQYNEIWSLHLTSWCNKNEKLWLELVLLLLRDRLHPQSELGSTGAPRHDAAPVLLIHKETGDSP